MGTNLTHAGIVPLIGGQSIGAELAHGAPPKHLMSYEAFGGHDQHIVNHYGGSVPYHVLDKDGPYNGPKADIVHSVCPCAGLSQMSHGYGDDNKNNEWMDIAAKYVLGQYRPTVYWGENAPALAGSIGKNVRNNLFNIGRDNGYSMLLYRTKTLLHGGPQVRERAFYFFFRGDKLPVFNYYNREHAKIEDVLRGVKSNFQTEPINSSTPSEDPYYRYILEVIHGGITHREYSANVEPANARGVDTLSYIERKGVSYLELSEWMKKEGYEREVAKCVRRHHKLAEGLSIMRRGVIIPKDRIGAFVGWYPTSLTHPDEDRFINYREAMTIMGLPDDFELIDPKKNVNHICQNVPVYTAKDMAEEVIQALEGNREWVDAHQAFQYNATHKYNISESSKKISTVMSLFD